MHLLEQVVVGREAQPGKSCCCCCCWNLSSYWNFQKKMKKMKKKMRGR